MFVVRYTLIYFTTYDQIWYKKPGSRLRVHTSATYTRVIGLQILLQSENSTLNQIVAVSSHSFSLPTVSFSERERRNKTE